MLLVAIDAVTPWRLPPSRYHRPQAEAIDLNALTVPTGTSVQYIDADEEDPASIRVPVWSLRAMALKTKRVEVSKRSHACLAHHCIAHLMHMIDASLRAALYSVHMWRSVPPCASPPAG